MSQKIKRKFFANNYSDYSAAAAQGVIHENEIHKESKIHRCIEKRWAKLTENFTKYLKHNDSSVYTGTAGIALLYLRRDPNSIENLKAAKELLQSRPIKSKRHLTFLCGDGGPLAVGAVVAHKLGDEKEYKSCISTLASLKTDAINYKSGLPNEFLYGRAGYLYALLYVNKNISPPPFDSALIKSVIEAILKSGKKFARVGGHSCPLMYEWHDSLYLGAAHGVSGILYLLMEAHEYLTQDELHNLIKPTIDYLTTLQFDSGNYPSSLDSQSGDKYVQWCHGAPGFLYMYCSAYRVFKDPKYLTLALKAGTVVWNRGLLKKGYSICHGVAGNAYCFLELYQTTKDIAHLYRAAKFAEWCARYTSEHEEYPPDRPLSLYEGMSGPMYLLLDMQKPLEAKFPGFSL